MLETSDNSQEETVSENVRISGLPESVTVTSPARRTWRHGLALPLLAVVVLAEFKATLVEYWLAAWHLIPQSWASRPDHRSTIDRVVELLIELAVLSPAIFPVIRELLGGYQRIHCTPEGLEVVRVDFGRTTYRKFYRRDAIFEMTYTNGFAGPRLSVLFEGQREPVLARIEAPEAQWILDSMYAMGYDTVRTPKLKSMAQKILGRRKTSSPLYR
jgi:hypothetical protein